MRLSKLHLDLSLSAFDSSIPSAYLRRNLECVFFIERISREEMKALKETHRLVRSDLISEKKERLEKEKLIKENV